MTMLLKSLVIKGKKQVEAGLEVSTGRISYIGRRYIGPRTWIAAVSIIVILSAGAYVYLESEGN